MICNRIKQYFRSKTPEQVFSFSLLVGCFLLMLFCAIVRICGGLWFTADTSLIKEPNEFWQTVIMASLLLFEITIVHKILSRKSWKFAFMLSLSQLALVMLIENNTIDSVINLLYYFVPHLIIHKKWKTLVESAFVYALLILYSLLFLVGRIGFVDGKQAHDFVTNVLTTIDYKLFVVSLYLFINNFGGVKLWKWRILV